MAGKLNSLTDVIKKTLFFFESLSVEELTPYVHRRMLRDYSLSQVEEKVTLCLRQNPCFMVRDKHWQLNLEGNRDNDHFYTLLVKKQKPLSVKEVFKGAKDKKKVKKAVAEEASLISDGRFIQLSSGYWGLTEWEVEADQYSLKHLIIKSLKIHPGGLSAQQIYELVNTWRATSLEAIEGVLHKFPYFESTKDNLWIFNNHVQVAYEGMTKRYLVALNRQKERWHRDRERWQKKVSVLTRQLNEVSSSYSEAASALALRAEEIGQHEHMVTQMAEKDLLLSLRKKEIFRYREHIGKLEAKCNAILHQCRLWVNRTRDHESQKIYLKEVLKKNQESLESMFTKLHQYKERERENKIKLSEQRESHTDKVAELQTEIVELRQKLERTRELAVSEEKRYREEIGLLNEDLKLALQEKEELNRSMRLLQHELKRKHEERKNLDQRLKHPVVRFALWVCSLLKPSSGKTV